jgi:hypothetical protein
MTRQTPLPIRNRIKEHRRVRAGELVPHELNWRRHSRQQRAALGALYQEVGFARSLLAFELPDGRLKLIDGHLRRDIDPDMLVDVEILDVDEAEARKLLLSIDSLAALAETDTAAVRELAAATPAHSAILADLWASLAQYEVAALASLPDSRPMAAEQFLILVECADENEQILFLERWRGEGIRCKALIS